MSNTEFKSQHSMLLRCGHTCTKHHELTAAALLTGWFCSCLLYWRFCPCKGAYGRLSPQLQYRPLCIAADFAMWCTLDSDCEQKDARVDTVLLSGPGLAQWPGYHPPVLADTLQHASAEPQHEHTCTAALLPDKPPAKVHVRKSSDSARYASQACFCLCMSSA